MKLFNLLTFLLIAGCSDLPPGPDGNGLRLSLEDVSCTKAWLRVQDSNIGGICALVRDENTISTFLMQVTDTVVVDQALEPGKTYTYQVRRIRGEPTRPIEVSGPVSVRTLDTTSQDITWQVSTLGDGSSSVLYDVAIINDTLAYAVGAIYKRDSVGNWDPNAYNVVKWNGTAWSLLRVQFYSICGQAGLTPYPASSVVAFSENDIWFAMDGSQVARWNGNAQTAALCLPVSFSIKKLWGESPNSVYAVGDGGNILHYANGAWQKLESGTTLDITDVFGAHYSSSGALEVLAVASKYLVNYERRVLRISGTTVTTLSDNPINSSLRSVWFMPGVRYYVVGDGIYEKASLQEATWANKPLDIAAYYTFAVRGTAPNNVLICGAFGETMHFNGVSWQSYLPQTRLPNGGYLALSVQGDQVIAVGATAGAAVIARGRTVK